MPALLMDFGGVIHRSALELLPVWAGHVDLPDEIGKRSGPFGSLRDELWHRMQRGEVHEREYWKRRAREIGASQGEEWMVSDLVNRISNDFDEATLVRPDALALIEAARAEGIALGVLSNDLEFFHGREWVTSQRILDLFHVVLDGSVTNVLKPDPRAYELAAKALGVREADLVFLDDQPWNVDGARKLGATAIRVDIIDPAPAFRAAGAALHLPSYRKR